jgi:hypothetical protein
MLSVKGVFKKGAAQPLTPLQGREGQPVIITFLEEPLAEAEQPEEQAAWSALGQLVQACAVATGVDDMAHQHNHYLYGTPKKAE